MVEKRSRPTIMDGTVVTFATAFELQDSVFGQSDRPIDPFEISASRNAVIVHRAEFTDSAHIQAFIEALQSAVKTASGMSRNGGGRFHDPQA